MLRLTTTPHAPTRKHIGRIVGLVVINSVLFVMLWLGLLFVTAVAGDVYNLVRWRGPDDRVALPNYPNKEKARRLFVDTKKTVEDYVPFLGWQRLPMTTENVNIAENGVRTHTTGADNNVPNATKIGFFGGSTIWGTGADDNNTIPAIFDQLTTGYEVTNYGEGGHNARQMMALLVNLIDTEQMPDVVVFYGGFNHIWTHCNYAVTRSLNSHMVERKLRERLTERPRGGYLYASLFKPPLDFARRIIGEKRFVYDDYACHDNPERAEQVADTMLRIWESADVLAKHWGGRFYAFLQPIAYIGEPRLDHLNLPRVLGAEQFRTVYPMIQEKAAASGATWFTDLSDALDVDEYVYIDDAHVSRNGNAIVAQRIVEAIP